MKYDALVIGAGPAGSMVSRSLSRSGWRVLLVDKDVPGRAKVCGGFIGPEMRTLLPHFMESEWKEFPKTAIKGVILSGGKAGAWNIPFDGQEGFAVDRGRFDAWLFENARGSGVETWVDPKFSSKSVDARFVIRCHGRRSASGAAKAPADKIFFACKTVYAGVAGLDGRVALHFIDKGHIGLNSIGIGLATLCLYVEGSYLREAKGDLDGMIKRFMRMNEALRHTLGMAERISEWHTCSAEPDNKSVFYENGEFYAGDAVTMVSPIIGGGIPIAIGSAGLLSRELIEGVRNEKSNAEIALSYRSAWERTFLPRLRYGRVLSAWERSIPASRAVFGALKICPPAAKTLVSWSRS